MKAILDRLLESEEDMKLIESFLSTRSILYNLEPIGLGTPYVESLTSYISRLAFAHNINVSTLLKGTVVPITEKKYLKNNLSKGVFGSTPKYINGNSQVSQDYVDVFEKLTGRNDLQFLTMLNWSAIFPQNTIGNHRKWCPVCLEKMYNESKEVYEPLIWYLTDVNKCDIHEVILENECHKCNRKLDFMYSKFNVGYCLYCSAWLGDYNGKNEPLNTKEIFINANYRQLIEKAPNLFSFPIKNSIGNVLRRTMEMLGFKSISTFSNFLEIGSSSLALWLNNKHNPSSKSFFQIAEKLNITIYELLYKENNNIKDKVKIPTEIHVDKSKISTEEVKSILMGEINSKAPKSLNQISKEYNFDVTSAKRHFPELCIKIKENYSSYKLELCKKKKTEIENILINALQKDIPVGLAEFSKEYCVPVITAKRYSPELSKQLVARHKDYIEEQKNKKIEKNCSEIKEIAINLHSKGIYPGIKRIQKEITNPNVFIKDIYRKEWRIILESLGYSFEDKEIED